jgi:hypothetical protein
MLFCNLIKSRIPTRVKIELKGVTYTGVIKEDKQFDGGKKIVVEMKDGPMSLSYRLYKENIIG